MQKYVFHLCFAVLFVFLPVAIFSWWAEPVHGDLTRIGKWTERDFGPSATPPAIEVKPTGESLVNADILVLGDSFSAENLWQSVFRKNKDMTVKSFHYEKNCLADWLDASIADKHSKVVIMQTVERNLISRFGSISKCRQPALIPVEVKAEIKDNKRHFWPLTTDPVYLGLAAFNTALSFVKDESYSKRFMTVNSSLKSGCALLSNRRNDKLLHYADDDLKENWSEKEIADSISNILKIQRAVEQGGKKFVFIIAPDKSTAYKKCIAGKNADEKMPNLNEALISAGVNAPDMTYQFQEKIGKVMDLYDPNNTHWSLAGYILAGETIDRFLGGDASIN